MQCDLVVNKLNLFLAMSLVKVVQRRVNVKRKLTESGQSSTKNTTEQQPNLPEPSLTVIVLGHETQNSEVVGGVGL